jgi:L-lactate dehydrogenase complex protein LldG
MTGAREEVLGRIRTALGAGEGVVEVPRSYRQAGAVRGDVVELFCERAADYLATVRRVESDSLAVALAQACAERGSTRIVCAPALSDLLAGTEPDGAHIAPAALDGRHAALTGCALAIAETGTIVLDGGPESGRRALTLVPDHHLCVVNAGQIVATVPDAIAALEPAARNAQPITFVSGPSATSDIELERVEGVHGPRKLDIFVVD